MMRRLFLPLFILVLLIFLSGCQAPPSSSASPSGVIHLKLWQGINPPANRDVFQQLVRQFNRAHPQIQVESIFAGAIDQQLPKILASVVGHSAPDLLLFYPQTTGKFVELDAIVSLDDWLQNLPVRAEIFPTLFEELRLAGKIWSIPYTTSNIGIFYRPKLFQAAGIEKLPQTWQELREVARQLTIDRDGDRRPEQYGMLLPLGKGEWTVFTWFPFLLSAGGSLVANDQPTLNHPGAIAALQFWQDLIRDGSATLSPPERGYEEDAFLEGRVAMQITGPWTYITKSDGDFGVFPIPADRQAATVTGTGNIYVMKSTPERQQAALTFLEYVLSQEFQTAWSMGTGFLPVNRKVIDSAAYQTYVQQKPWLQVFLDQIPIARARPIVAHYPRISDSLGRAIETALVQLSPVGPTLDQAQQRLEIIWDKAP